MIVLGIETATAVCGAAVVADGKLVSETQVVEKYAHAESIMRLIDESLRRACVALKDVHGIAVSIGPGSFTGLRIGLSVVKGFSYALDKPIVAVPTLRALAQRAVDANRVATPFILPAIDARRDEVYCQLFRVERTRVVPEWDERDDRVSSLTDELSDMALTVTGDGAAKVKGGNAHARWEYIENEVGQCSAATVALIGERMARAGEVDDHTTLEPRYVKETFLISKT